MEPPVCKIRWGPTAETLLIAAHDDFDAFKMTLKALIDGGGASMHSGVDYDTLSTESGSSCGAILCFLRAVRKMPTKLEGDCPGIAIWPLATGLYLPKKNEEYTNLTSKLAVSQLAGLQKWED